MAGNVNDFQSENYEGNAEINIIPLVDVMLVLLIVFMVAAPLSITGIAINLPKSAAKGVSIAEQKVVLTINADGVYYFDKTPVDRNNLEKKLKSIFEFREDKGLYIRADRAVRYSHVVDAMSAAKLAGVQKMSMLTKQKS